MKHRSIKRLVAVVLAERRSGRDRRRSARDDVDRRIPLTEKAAQALAARRGDRR